jgi:hypothetical protein
MRATTTVARTSPPPPLQERTQCATATPKRSSTSKKDELANQANHRIGTNPSRLSP